MTSPIQLGINDKLLMKRANDPVAFGSEITSKGGKCIGQWIAFCCLDRSALFQRICLDSAGREYLLDRIPNLEASWPMAYLSDIQVNSYARRKGVGSKALSIFLGQAVDAGCRGALARVGFKNWQERERNIQFYRKNGWKLLTRDEDFPYPLDLAFLTLDRPCVPRTPSFSAKEPSASSSQ